MNARLDARWPEVEHWLDRALDQPAAQREAWLRERCDDAELRELVSGLLQADAVHGPRLDAQADALSRRGNVIYVSTREKNGG